MLPIDPVVAGLADLELLQYLGERLAEIEERVSVLQPFSFATIWSGVWRLRFLVIEIPSSPVGW